MKKILFFLMSLCSANLFASIYCPQTLSCNNQGCSPLPPGISLWSGGKPGTYSFYLAISNSGMDSHCEYEDNSSNKLMLKVQGTADRLKPNQWKMIGNVPSWFGCQFNAMSCPYK